MLRRTACHSPTGTAMTSARIVEKPTRMIVFGSRSPSSEATDWSSFQENPRFPCSRWPSQSRYWENHGLSNPYWALNWASAAGLRYADGPRIATADIAGDRPQQDEGDHRDKQHDDRRLQDSPNEKANQVIPPNGSAFSDAFTPPPPLAPPAGAVGPAAPGASS